MLIVDYYRRAPGASSLATGGFEGWGRAMSLESMRAKDGRMDEGESVASVARHVGVSRQTAGKRTRMIGLSPEPPRMRQPQSEGTHSPLSLCHLDKETAPLPVLVRVARTGEALRRI